VYMCLCKCMFCVCAIIGKGGDHLVNSRAEMCAGGSSSRCVRVCAM